MKSNSRENDRLCGIIDAIFWLVKPEVGDVGSWTEAGRSTEVKAKIGFFTVAPGDCD
jgi:hypothetical protein